MDPATPAAVESAIDILLQSILNQNHDALQAMSTPHSSSYRTDTKTRTSLLTQVDDYAEAMISTPGSDQHRLLEKVSTLRTHCNRIIPLHQLPIEIFVRIITGALGPLRTLDGSDSTHLARLVRLCQVCKHWKDVIDDTPSLWATIDVLDPAVITSTAISRSACHPLNIIAAPHGRIREDYHVPRRLDEFINTVMTLSTRWRSVQLVFESAETAQAIMNAPAPLLQTLDLKPTTQIWVSSQAAFQRTDPQLRRLRLCRVATQWDSCLLHGLQYLSISQLSRLAPSCKEILGILGACPGLVELELSLNYARPVEGPKRATPFTLTKLQSLSLYLSPTWTLDLLEIIRFPSVETVSLNLDFDNSNSIDLFPQMTRHIQALFPVVFKSQYKLRITVSSNTLLWAYESRETTGGSRELAITAERMFTSAAVRCLIETFFHRFPANSAEFHLKSVDYSGLQILQEFDGLKGINPIAVTRCDLDEVLAYMSGPTTRDLWGFPEMEELSIDDCYYDPERLLSMLRKRYGLQKKGGGDVSGNDQLDLPLPLKRIKIKEGPGEGDWNTFALVEDIVGPGCLEFDEYRTDEY
ncbi:hypothetical protein FS837_008932 [Tulasnella sp. UAMH 9824]|nr:hypothetical protein FS837_008932 [Tulasnella sp. UAMH 9824]